MIWLVAGGTLLLWYLLVRYFLYHSHVTSHHSSLSQLCPSPDCVRCSGSLKALYSSDAGDKLKRMYGKYESLTVHKVEERLTFDMSGLGEGRRPTVCYLRQMCNEPWHTQKQEYLQNLLVDSYSVIKGEVATALTNTALWSVSDSNATGKWQKLFLYNQGKKVESNCQAMPLTTALIEGLDTFMSSVIFGNAFVSILNQQSEIPSHCGPTNLRVRCHLGLQVPEGECSITVNGISERWANRECIMFDDSFLHCASNQTDSQRIVLIVDLWHPNLTLTEIKIFSELFAVKQ